MPTTSLLLRLQALPAPGVFPATELLGQNPSLQELRDFAALRRARRILRLARGWYVATRQTRWGICPPPLEDILAALAAHTGEIIVPTGASAANVLRLSTQVPIRQVYWTSGPGRRLHLGKLDITLRHQPQTWLRQPGLTGQILRALEWMGPALAPQAVRRLHHLLPPEDWAIQLLSVPGIPQWLRTAVEGEASQQALGSNRDQRS